MKLNKIHEVLNSANSLFLVTLTVCCHPESLLPWERDVMTSSLLMAVGYRTIGESLTCEQALQARGSGSGVRKGRRACNYICGI